MSEQRLKVESGPPQSMMSDGGEDVANDESPGEKAQEVKDRAQVAAAPVAEKAQEVKGKAQEAVGPAKEKVRAVAGEAKGHAQAAAEQAKSQAAAQVDVRSTQVGQQVGSQGDVLQGVAGELRDQGNDGAARVAEQAAEKVKRVGEYLEQADGEKLVGAAQQVARDNPAAAAAVGAAAGFAAGRVIKAALDDGEDQPVAPAVDEPGAAGSGGAA